MRYFKCHTLPYPTYDLSAAGGASSGTVDLTWKHGPPGANATGLTVIEYAMAINTTAISVAAVAYTAESGTVSGLTPGANYRFIVYRSNTIGVGERTPFVQARAS